MSDLNNFWHVDDYKGRISF